MVDDRYDASRSGEVARSAPSRDRHARVEFLPNVDGRTQLARRWQQFASDIVADQGGADNVSTTRLFLCKRLAAVSAMIEDVEAAHLRGEPINHELHLSMIQTSVRLANTIGLNRKTKAVPTLEEYLGNPRNGNVNGHVARDGELIAPRRNAQARRTRIEDDGDDE